MKQTLNGVPTPTANLTINKSRMKVYGKNSEVPTYYLNKGQEFQIELFNPTTNNILAKISLNGKPIAQGGLVLRPGERAFLDRYIDVARKFKFDTYEVANTNEVKEAIKDNGDFKVEFYAEYVAPPVPVPVWNPNEFNIFCDGNFGGNIITLGGPNSRQYGTDSIPNYVGDNLKTTNVNYNQPVSGNINLTHGTTNLSTTNGNSLGIVATATATAVGSVGAEATLDAMNLNFMDFAPTELKRSAAVNPIKKLKSLRRRVSKSIETGRVEAGSHSSQQMTTVNMNWLTIPFHTVEYKMLPLSQKVNTVEDTQVKAYCTNCGSKNKSSFKFCPSCGERA